MADKEIRFKLGADAKELSDAFKNAERDADNLEKKSQRAAMSLSDIAKAVASAFAGAKIISFFKSATDEATKLESALAKVSSAARAYGQSANAAKDAAMSLAQDGFMSAEQAAQSLSNLMAVGLNVDQAKKFVAASKDITAFGNTIGDAAQATQDLTLGLLRGSALVIDNASPALKSLSKEYEQILNKSGKAAAAQYAYNQILKESAKFAGDAEKYMNTAAGAQQRLKAATDSASAALGKALQPILISITRALTSVIESFEKWFTSLNPAAQTIAVLGAGFVALLPVVASLIPVVKGLGTALLGLAANPVILALAGIAAAVTALGIAYAQAQTKLSETQKKINEIAILKDEVAALEKAKVATVEYTQAKERLNAATKQLIEQYKDELAAINANNESLETQLKIIERIDLEKRKMKESGLDLESVPTETLKRELNELRKKTKVEFKFGGKNYSLPSSGALVRESRALTGETGSGLESAFATDSSIVVLSDKGSAEARAAAIEAELKRREKRKQKSEKIIVKREPIEVRYIEAQKKIDEIKKKLTETEETIKLTIGIDKAEVERRVKQAKADAQAQIDAELNELRSRYAAYIEDRAEAARIAREKEKEQAIRASEELFEAELKAAGKNAKEIERIKREHEERKLAIARAAIIREARDRAQAFADTAQAAEKMVSSISQMMSAKTAGAGIGAFGGFLGGLSGLSAFMPALSALGPIGAGIGAVGGIVSTLEDIFGKSDEERRQEAERAARIAEEQKKLLELQANYQKQMLAIQEAQAKLPFENVQRQLRLIDIQAQQRRVAGENEAVVERERLEARRAAIQAVLESEAGAIAQTKFFTYAQGQPESLTKVLSDAAKIKIEFSAIQSLMQERAKAIASNSWTTSFVRNWILQFVQEAQRLGFSDVFADQTPNVVGLRADRFAGKIVNGQLVFPEFESDKERLFAAAIRELSGQMFEFENAMSGVRVATSIAESTLSLIEQQLQTQLEIEKATKQTAQNTQLQLESDRAAAFIDIAGGGIRQFGGFLASTPLALSENAQSVVLSSLAARAIEKTDVELLAEILTVSKDMRELLAEIALNTNRTAGNFGGLSETDLLDMLERFRSRS